MAKSSGKSVAKKAAGGKSLMAWQERLKKRATAESERTQAGAGNKISLRKNLQFRYQGADIGKEIKGVIIGHIYVNRWFEGDYDEDKITAPTCQAMSTTGKDMAPLDNSPAKQDQICADCWAHQWKSDKREKGRACKNQHDLKFIFEDDLANIADAELAGLTVPVTSGAAFRKYVKKLTDSNETPSFAVITKITMDPDAENQKLVFEMEEMLTEEQYDEIEPRADESMKTLMERPDFSAYVPSKGKSAAKPGAKKKSGSVKKSRMSR